jgi:lipoprotein-releasing system permease protein
LNLPFFIAQRLSVNNQKGFSSKIVNLAIAGVALGFAVIVISIATVNGFQKEIKQKIAGFSGDIEIRKTGSTGNYDYPLFQIDDETISKIKQLKGVDFVNITAAKPAIIKANEELTGVVYKGIDSNYNRKYFENYLIVGRMPLAPGEIIISKFMAKQMGLTLNNKVRSYFIIQPVRAIAPTVVGIYQTGLEEHDKSFVLGNIVDVQRVFADRAPSITHIELSIHRNFNPIDVQQELYEILNYDLDVFLASEIHPQIFQWLEYLDVNKFIILGLMIFVSGISLITALLILVIERANMIGILKTLGASNAIVKRIFLIKASYIALTGMVIGNIVGLGLCLLQQKFGFFKLNQETYYLENIPVELNIYWILLVNVGCFALCFAALLIPVQIVSRVSPARSVRFD